MCMSAWRNAKTPVGKNNNSVASPNAGSNPAALIQFMIIGQKVVCVDDVFPESMKRFISHFPVKDRVYVIRAVVTGVDGDMLLMDRHRKETVALLLIGIVNPTGKLQQEPAFLSTRFRPLQEITTTNRERQTCGA